MTTGQQLIDAAITFLGEPYSTDNGRDDPESGFKDCSGLIAASYKVATGTALWANVSVTIYDLCVKQGLWISRDDAFGIAGACLLMPEDPYRGWGPAGHIGFSDGQGGTVEATPPRVQRLRNTYQDWGSNACLLPGIDYSNGGQGSTQTEILRKAQSMLLVRNTDKPQEAEDNWFLFNGLGQASPITHQLVWDLAVQGVTAVGLTSGQIWDLAVQHAKISDGFINRMKELGVGGSTVIEKPVLVPADPTTLTDEQVLAELQRRMND